MLLAKELKPCKVLKQSNPMLMIKSVDKFISNEIICTMDICDTWKDRSREINIWMIIESMGQAAEILIRLKGAKGQGYLAKIDNFNFKEEVSNLEYESFVIKAKIQSNFMNYFVSYVELSYKNRVVATGEVTHCFK